MVKLAEVALALAPTMTKLAKFGTMAVMAARARVARNTERVVG